MEQTEKFKILFHSISFGIEPGQIPTLASQLIKYEIDEKK